MDAKLREEEPEQMNLDLDLDIQYFNGKNCKWEPLLEPVTLRVGADFIGNNRILLNVTDLNLNISPQIVQLLSTVQKSIGKVQKGKFVKYFMINDTGFSLEFNSSNRNRKRRLRNKATYKIQNMQLKQLLNKKYSSLMDIQINYFIKRMGKHLILKRLLEQEYAVQNKQSFSYEMDDSFFSAVDLQLIFTGLTSPQPTNTFVYKHLFQFERLMDMNMDMEGVHFNLLPLETQIKEQEKEQLQKRRNIQALGRFSAQRRQTMYFASKLKSQATLASLETMRNKRQTEVVDFSLNRNVAVSSWLVVTDIQSDKELVSKHIHIRSPLRIKNNLNIPLTILLTCCLSLPDGDQASRQIYYREQVHPSGMFCVPLQFMHKALMYITISGAPLIPLFKKFSGLQNIPEVVNFGNINIHTFAQESRWYISKPIEIEDHKFKMKTYFEGFQLYNFAHGSRKISIAGILDWTNFQHVHYSQDVTKANRTGRPDCKVFKDYVLILSAPLIISNKLTERARIKLFESKSNGVKEVKRMNRDGYAQKQVYSLANRSQHDLEVADGDHFCESEFVLESNKNKQYLPAQHQIQWKNKFLSIKMEKHGWSKAVPISFLVPRSAKKQTLQIPLGYERSQVYLTAEVDYHSQGCCFVTFFSPFLIYNDTHYPMKLIESHVMKRDRTAKGMKVPPRPVQKQGDLQSIKKHYNMLLFSKKYNKVKLRLLDKYLTSFSKHFCLSKTFTDGNVSLQGIETIQGTTRGYELGIDTPAVATMMRSKVLTVRYKYILLNYCDFPLQLKQVEQQNQEKCLTVGPFGYIGLEWMDSHKSKKLHAKILPLFGKSQISTFKRPQAPRFSLPQNISEESDEEEAKLKRSTNNEQFSQFRKMSKIGAQRTDKSLSQVMSDKDKSRSMYIEDKNQWSSPFIISKVADFTIFPGYFHQAKQYIHVSVQEQSDGTFSVIFHPGRFNLLGIVNTTEFAVQAYQEDTDKVITGVLLEPESQQVEYPWPDNTLPLNLELQIENKKVTLMMNSPKVFKDVKIKYEDIISEVTLGKNCVYRGDIFLSLYGQGFWEVSVFIAFHRLYYQFKHREGKRKYQMLGSFHSKCNLALIQRNQNLLEIRLDQNTTLKGLNTIQTKEVFNLLEIAKKRLSEENQEEKVLTMRLEPKFQQIVLMIRQEDQLKLINEDRKASFLGDASTVKINFTFSLIGISLIDETPEQLFYLSMKRIKGELKQSNDGRYLKFQIEKIQMDNHIQHCNFKVAISSLQRKEQPMTKMNKKKSKFALVVELKQKNVDEQSQQDKGRKRESSNSVQKIQRHKGGIKEMVQFGENINRFKLRQYNYVYLQLVNVIVADFEIRMEFKVIGPLIKFTKSVSKALGEDENEHRDQSLGFLQTFNRTDQIGVVVQSHGEQRYRSVELYAFDQKEAKRERSAALPQDVREQNESQNSRLKQSLTEKRYSTFSLKLVEDIPVIQIKKMNVSSFALYLSYSASPTFSGTDNAEKYTKALLKDSGLALATIQDSRLSFKKFQIREQFLPQDQLIKSLSSHYKKSLMYQLYKVVGSIELIGKPFQYFDNIAEEVEDIQDIEDSDLSNQKRCSRYTRGCCRIVCGFASSFFGSAHSITKSGANLISPLTFDDTYRKYRFEEMTKPKHSSLSALWSAFYLLFLGIVFAFLGIFYFPCSTCKKGKRKNFNEWLVAIIRGLVGFLVKITVGVIDFVSYLGKFLSLLFRGKKFKRNNPFRKKRVFRNGMFKVYNRYDAEAEELIKNTRIQFGLDEEVFLTALSQASREHRAFHALFISSRGRFDRIILIRNKGGFSSQEIIREQVQKVEIRKNHQTMRIYLRNQKIQRPIAKMRDIRSFDIREFGTQETKYFTDL